MNQAALRAAADHLESVSMKHLEEARDKVLMGMSQKYLNDYYINF